MDVIESPLVETLLSDAYRRKTIGWVKNLGFSFNDAEDLYQRLSVRVISCSENYDWDRSAVPYLNQIMRNIIIDAYIKNGCPKGRAMVNESNISTIDNCFFDGVAIDSKSPFGNIENIEKARIVEDILDDIPDKYSSLLRMHYFDGMSYNELSEIRGMPIGTVKSRLHNARNLFKTVVEDMNVKYQLDA